VPRTSITAKYAWLGADQRPTELPTGIINMGARTYIPQLGRFEQTDPQPGGSVNAYAYTNDDPVNEADPSGEWTYNTESAEPGEPAPGTPRSGLAVLPDDVVNSGEGRAVADGAVVASRVVVLQPVWQGLAASV
jgi:RHS repeat-associated protein